MTKTTFSRKEKLAAISRALLWLEANPDKHIAGAYAKTSPTGARCPPSSKEATCFCVVGRIALEADIKVPATGTMRRFLEGTGVELTSLVSLNDYHVLYHKDKVIPTLRNYTLGGETL